MDSGKKKFHPRTPEGGFDWEETPRPRAPRGSREELRLVNADKAFIDRMAEMDPMQDAAPSESLRKADALERIADSLSRIAAALEKKSL